MAWSIDPQPYSGASAAKGAVLFDGYKDNVWVQFYPTLRKLMPASTTTPPRPPN
jgi:hypothetical protein